MIYSFSAINTYLQCPRKFREVYVDRTVKDRSTEITKGEILHKQCEDYLNGERDELPDEAPRGGFLEWLRKAGAEAEASVAITAEFAPCGFWENDKARLRGKLDAALVLPEHKYVLMVDWKTGKKRDNTLQKQTYATMGQAYWPGYTIDVVFDYLSKGRQPPMRAEREDMRHVNSLMDTIDRAETYPPRPSPLCRWCAVTHCEYNEREA